MLNLSFVIALSLVPFFSITSLLCWLWFSSYISLLTDNVMGQLLIKVMVDVIMFDSLGFFLIRRGTDECGIEDGVTAGVPAM